MMHRVLIRQRHLASSLDEVFVATAAKRWKALTFASTVWRRWLRSLPSGAVQLLICIFTLGLPAASAWAQLQLQYQLHSDRLAITSNKSEPVIEFVFSDPEILRPYFTRAHSPSGKLLTRRHPPSDGIDATDHATMHPGIWLALGDINGQDFWRNKATIQHRQFNPEPNLKNNRLEFGTESQLIDAQGQSIGQMINHFALAPEGHTWLILWRATFQAGQQPLVLGDQEEMGFGARVATEIIEKRGGTITNSNGLKGAAQTWGQPAPWCDYSGTIDGQACGLTLIASPENFRISHWHNRDYGLMVANPFALAAMKQGSASQVIVPPGKPLTVAFAAILHDDHYDPQQAYQSVVEHGLLKLVTE